MKDVNRHWKTIAFYILQRLLGEHKLHYNFDLFWYKIVFFGNSFYFILKPFRNGTSIVRRSRTPLKPCKSFSFSFSFLNVIGPPKTVILGVKTMITFFHGPYFFFTFIPSFLVFYCTFLLLYVTWSREMSHLSKISIPIFS